MFKGPFDPTFIEFLHKICLTILEVSTLWAILLHSWLCYSRKTGRRPSFSSRDWVRTEVPDFAYFWCWRWEGCLWRSPWLRNETRHGIDSWRDRLQSRGCTACGWRYISVIDLFGIVDIAWVEVGVDGDGSKIKCFMGMWDRIVAIFHDINKINTMLVYAQ